MSPQLNSPPNGKSSTRAHDGHSLEPGWVRRCRMAGGGAVRCGNSKKSPGSTGAVEAEGWLACPRGPWVGVRARTTLRLQERPHGAQATRVVRGKEGARALRA